MMRIATISAAQMAAETGNTQAGSVTPQAAVMASGVPFAVTHAPGHMFITDVPDSHYHV